MKQSSRNRARWVVGAAAAAVLACGYALTPRERLLMQDSRRIIAVDNGGMSPVLWQSAQNALLVTYRPTGDRFEFEELDTATGIRKPNDLLNRKLVNYLQSQTLMMPNTAAQFPAAGTFHLPPQCVLSPDGKWLLCEPSFRGGDVSATALKSSEQVRWPAPRNATGFVLFRLQWFHDYHRWIAEQITAVGKSVRAEFAIRDTADPKRATYLPDRWGGNQMTLIGVSHDERLVFTDWGGARAGPGPRRYAPSVDLAERGTLPTDSLHSFTVQLPRASAVRAIQLSTAGDRIVWQLEYSDAPLLSTWIHPFIRSWPLHSRPMVGLWVSRLDGSAMTEIGHRLLQPTSQHDQVIHDLQWLPGDRKLSFICDGSLYIVSVP